jgi:N-acetylglucosaminyl-diphospho-decaprenol L-rhamnosyltransferase
MQKRSISVVILSWNTREILRDCLVALQLDFSPHSREIIVVDNGSEDGSADMVAREFPDVKLIRNSENRLYSEANNQGAQLATGEYLCILNSDTSVRVGAIDQLVAYLESHPEYGAAAPKLVNPNGSVQRACNRFPDLFSELLCSSSLSRIPPLSLVQWWKRMRDFDHLYSRDVPQPPGACMLMRRQEYLSMGGLDPVLSLFFNDVDLCKRLWSSGRKIRYVAEAEVIHHGGFSTRIFKTSNGNKIWFINRAAYFRKYYGRFGVKWMNFVLWVWGFECGMRIRLGSRSAMAKREALVELKSFLGGCYL